MVDASSRVFHRAGCPLARAVPREFRRVFDDVESAVKSRYAPCLECNDVSVIGMTNEVTGAPFNVTAINPRRN